ncbi:MAG: dephospho-CoA kinase [Alphaproteobacteria bacterium]|nr:MAG: dephospho-CoA kinase [Alphaproteobacteria bacterium]
MIVLGLTGSIAMGKSEAARMLRRFGVPVFDSDAMVHALLAPAGEAFAEVAAAFPEAIVEGAVDRRRLGAIVFVDAAARKRLEAILHPRVFLAQRRFLEKAERGGARIAALEIPLLFETGGEKRVDHVAVVSAPPEIQRARALTRPGMTAERLDAILKAQLPDSEKCRRADYVLPTGGSKRALLRAIARMLRDLCERPGGVWPWPRERTDMADA